MIAKNSQEKNTENRHPYVASDNCPDLIELSQKFGPKKSDSMILSRVYDVLGMTSRSERVSVCGTFLEFSHEFNVESGEFSDKGRLTNANFCRDLLCPMCSWRKSLKQIAQISRVLNHETIKGKYKYLMLTLTIPNVSYSKLSLELINCYLPLIDLCGERNIAT